MSGGRFDLRGVVGGLWRRMRRRACARFRMALSASNPLWPWRDVDPDAPVPEEGDYYYGGGGRWHAGVWGNYYLEGGWEAATEPDSGVPAADGASQWLRSTGQQTYWDAGAGAWVYDSERAHEVIARCHGLATSEWDSFSDQVRLLGVIETEGIYAALVEGAYYWYAGDPTRPGEDVIAYRLIASADEAGPPVGVIYEWVEVLKVGLGVEFHLTSSPFTV